MRLLALAIAIIAVGSGCVNNSDGELNSTDVHNPRLGIWQDAAEPPVRFVLEQTWGVEDGEPEDMIARIGRIVVDQAGNLYSLDGQSATLTSWDSEGQHRWTLSGEGEGPGEFRYAFSMVHDGDGSLYVFNQSGTRVDRFSTEGQFLESTPTESVGYGSLGGIGMPSPDVLVASERVSGIWGAGIRVLRRESSGWVAADSFNIDQSEGQEVPPGLFSGPPVQVLGKAVVNGHVSRYQFEFRDLTGQVERTVTRSVQGLVPPGVAVDGNSRMIAIFSQLGTVHLAADGFYLVEAFWPDQDIDPNAEATIMLKTRRTDQPWSNQSTLDVFDSDFQLLYSIESEGRGHEAFGRVLASDTQGRIYAVTNAEFPQIGRYRVEISAPE